MAAAERGSLRAMLRLLAAPATDINASASLTHPRFPGCTALHVAASAGDLPILLRLLEAGAAVDRENALGCTPLLCAWRLHLDGAVLALLSHGADPAQLEQDNSRDFRAFCRENEAALREAAAAWHLRLEQRWQRAAAPGSAAPGGSGGGRPSGGASSSRSGRRVCRDDGASTSAPPAGPAGGGSCFEESGCKSQQCSSKVPTSLPAPRLPAALCPICMSEASDFQLEGCAHTACFDCLRTHAATEVRQGQRPRCPLCMPALARRGAAAGAAASRASKAAGASSSSQGLISSSQLEVLLEAAELLVLERRQVGAALTKCA